jgi:4-aminobutyrate aminotransferase-like enzyme
MAVLRELSDRRLQTSAHAVGLRAREVLAEIANGRPDVATVRGNGLFFGLEFVDADDRPASEPAKWVVEDMRRRGVLISRIGPHGNVLKIRPPMVFESRDLELLMSRLATSLDASAALHVSPRG